MLRRGDLRVVLHVGDDATVPLDGTVTHVLAAWDTVVPGPDGLHLPGPGAAVVRVTKETR